ncbi:MAG: hypothetical protein GF329_13235 [Candidatus Lokiarchaeota archaeon]|nr:hypothetical protein [Candidatus Lokiarchaeota archaeon]
MDLFEGPTDVFGMAIYNSLLDKVETDPKYEKFVQNLEEKVMVDLDYYSLLIKFEKGKEFEVIKKEEAEEKSPDNDDIKPTIRVKIKVQNFLDILEGKSSIIKSFLTGQLKFKKGFLKIYKVYKLFSKMMS